MYIYISLYIGVRKSISPHNVKAFLIHLTMIIWHFFFSFFFFKLNNTNGRKNWELFKHSSTLHPLQELTMTQKKMYISTCISRISGDCCHASSFTCMYVSFLQYCQSKILPLNTTVSITMIISHPICKETVAYNTSSDGLCTLGRGRSTCNYTHDTQIAAAKIYGFITEGGLCWEWPLSWEGPLLWYIKPTDQSMKARNKRNTQRKSPIY